MKKRNTIKKAVIIAGGKGSRISPFIKDIPKALIKVGDKPIIEHQISLLNKYGIREIWILVGHLGEQIKDHLQSGEKWNVKLHYNQETKLLGTAGALRALEGKIRDDFLVFSGDVMLDIDIKRFINQHKKKKNKIATFIIHPNDHPVDSDLVEVNQDGEIMRLNKRPHSTGENYHNLSIASVYIFSPKIFKFISKRKKNDIEKDILPLLLKAKEKIYTYNTPEYIKDAGTIGRLKKVRKDHTSGRIKKLNLKSKRKAVFLDRDGVINKETDQLSKVRDLKIYSFAAKAIKQINNLNYLTVLVTNQPMLAKGFMTEDHLNEINKKIETELGFFGAKIDAFYYCPHHPEKGFVGEIPELKIKCNCRKPQIGLLLKAKKDLNINLKQSYLIGDQTSDILAGKRAGCKTILVKTGYKGKDKKFFVKPDFIVNNLFEATKILNSATKL